MRVSKDHIKVQHAGAAGPPSSVFDIHKDLENSLFPFSFLLYCSLINKLQPGSVKKINQSALNWHQVSCSVTHSFELIEGAADSSVEALL